MISLGWEVKWVYKATKIKGRENQYGLNFCYSGEEEGQLAVEG